MAIFCFSCICLPVPRCRSFLRCYNLFNRILLASATCQLPDTEGSRYLRIICIVRWNDWFLFLLNHRFPTPCRFWAIIQNWKKCLNRQTFNFISERTSNMGTNHICFHIGYYLHNVPIYINWCVLALAHALFHSVSVLHCA